MRVCLINNEYFNKDIGYLFYRESDKSFSIELDEDAWSYFPILLRLLAEKGMYSIDPYWSMRFVADRVVPIDRQNIKQILKKVGLKEYDVYKLLVYCNGRCAQDDCSIIPLSKDYIYPEWLTKRLNDKIKSVTIPENNDIYIELQNGRIYKNSLVSLFEDDRSLSILLERRDDLLNYSLMINGNGLFWYNRTYITVKDLLKNAVEISIDSSFINEYLAQNIVSTADACEKLNCTRQYIDQLVKQGRLHPIMEAGNNRFYLLSEVNKYLK